MQFYQPNPKRFSKAFHKPKSWFKQFGDSIDIPGRPDDLLVHQDNGKKILIVCHTDFVIPWMSKLDARSTYAMYNPDQLGKKGKLITLPELTHKQKSRIERRVVKNQAKQLTGPVVDDRLGAAMALGMSGWADLLFTDCEEQGKSTAAYFKAPRDYNWIVGLDRRGTDVVTYQYKDKEWLSCLGKHFKVGFGSWSDIGYLEGLGRSAVNVGIGYHNEHTRGAFWNPKETNAQLGQLWAFWKEFGETIFTHKPAKVVNPRANRHDHVPHALNPANQLELIQKYNHRNWGDEGHLVGRNHDNRSNTSWIGEVKHYWSGKLAKWLPVIKSGYNIEEGYYSTLDQDWEEQREREWKEHLSWLEEEYPGLFEQLTMRETEEQLWLG